MDFTQMTPNFFRYFLTTWFRAREEGLKFGLAELKQLFTIKRNNRFSGTMILTPREGRSIIGGIPNRDDRWREKFFVFKINPASVGDFDFTRTLVSGPMTSVNRLPLIYFFDEFSSLIFLSFLFCL